MKLKLQQASYQNLYLHKSIENINKVSIDKENYINKSNVTKKKHVPFTTLSLNDLSNKRLSILQDIETDRFIYRKIDIKTNSIKNQYPNENELARIAFLKKLKN